MKENRRVILDEIAAVLKMSNGCVQHNIHDILNFLVSARWVPKQFIAELKQRRYDACEESRYEAEDAFFTSKVHYHQPKENTPPFFPEIQKNSYTTLGKKHYLDSLGCKWTISEDYMPSWIAVTSVLSHRSEPKGRGV